MRLNKTLAFYCVKSTRGWPPQRRMAQSARARAAQIWRKSRGPKTQAGKAKSAQNARKHGLYDAGWRALRRALRDYGRFLQVVTPFLQNRKSFSKWHEYAVE